MGSSMSGVATFNDATSSKKETDINKNWFRVDPVMLTKLEVEDILDQDTQKPGTYVVYEDLDKEKTYLAFKASGGKVHHHLITKINDLFYFNDFPFPYMESIILYYKKHKFRGTKLKRQAFVNAYLMAHRQHRQQRSPGLKHVDAVVNFENGSYRQLTKF